MKKLNLFGRRFGKLIVLSGNPDGKWECRCICGTVKSVSTSHLRSGHTSSCGRCGKQIALKGKVFSRLTVIGITERRDKSGNVMWYCRCECGKELVVSGSSLRTGNTQSCGCLKKEVFTNFKHGQSHSPLYAVWEAMIQRCSNPNDKKFSAYGGRGIMVCDEWRHSFQAFCDWAIENGYELRDGKAKLTIDRRNNDHGYEPDNCQWVTYTIQNLNRRRKAIPEKELQ